MGVERLRVSGRSGRGKDVKDAAGKQVQAGQRRGLPCVRAVLLGHQVAGGAGGGQPGW